MAAYLQSWVQNSKDLPAELVRCFKLLQELDQRSHRLQQSVNQAATEQLKKVGYQPFWPPQLSHSDSILQQFALSRLYD